MRSAPIPLGPKIEGEILNIWIQLRTQFEKSLQNMPCTDCSGVGGIGSVGVDKRVTSFAIIPCAFIGKPNSNRLRKIKHIAMLIPRVWIQLCLEILGNIARSMLLEETDQGIASRSAVLND